MPSLSLDLGDAGELAEILHFLSEWLAADEPRLGASLTVSSAATPTTSASYTPTWTGSRS
jgi:hypothetical protein